MNEGETTPAHRFFQTNAELVYYILGFYIIQISMKKIIEVTQKCTFHYKLFEVHLMK